jgi:uncharacterized protein
VIVVLDTNVWISALQFAKHRGTPTRALEKAMSEDVIASCREIEAEILRVLTHKFAWESTRARAALDTVLARAIRVQLRGTVKECRDPNDDMFLECAMRAKADLLIAGDKDLRVLGSYPVVICHYAMRVWNRSHHGAWHRYGHSHGNLPDTPTSLSMDVGVDTHDFRRWRFDEINLLMTEKAKGLSELRRTDPLNIQ